jgi:uncharacterized membrane protein
MAVDENQESWAVVESQTCRIMPDSSEKIQKTDTLW